MTPGPDPVTGVVPKDKWADVKVAGKGEGKASS